MTSKEGGAGIIFNKKPQKPKKTLKKKCLLKKLTAHACSYCFGILVCRLATMDVHIEIVRAEMKGITNYELQCQAETKNDGAMNKSAAIDLQNHNTWPKFSYNFKQTCPSAAFLFSINTPDLEEDIDSSSTVSQSDKPPKTIAKSLFPYTFSVSKSKYLQQLVSEVSVRAKQVQIAYLTSDVEGSDIKKVVGTIWFKVVCPKSIPKIKSRVTWMDLNAVLDHLAEPEKSIFPSLPELLERENELSTSDPFLSDSPKLSVVFHSVNTYLKAANLTPAAKIGSNVITREKSLFENTDGSKSLYTHQILKPVALTSEGNEGYVELYLANNDLVVFSAAHSLQKLLPFKQYNWEYNWRWMAGTGGHSALHHSSGMEEPTMTASVMLTPSVSQYPKFEGLEFLVYGIELDSSLRSEDVVLLIEFADLARSQTALNTKMAPFMNNKENTVAVVKYEKTSETSPAYVFYPLHPFFRSKAKGVSIILKLYAPSRKHKTKLWWQSSQVASTNIEIPSTMSSVLSSPDNANGVYWEINDSDIAQSDSESVAHKIFGVLRWKSTSMKFLNADVGTQMHSLPNFNDLSPVKGIQPGLLTSILSKELRDELEKESKPESTSDYKTAVKKMGVDILQLREQNKNLRRDIKRLEEHLLQLESSVILSSADQAALSALTKADLIHKILEQSQRLSTEITAKQLLQNKVKTLQNVLIEKNEVEAKLIQVQEAHSAQQKLVRHLQLKYEKYRKCSDICKQQEEIIVQLESLLEQNAQNVKVKEAIAVLSKENTRLRKSLYQNQELSSNPRQNHTQEATISALRADVSKLRAKCVDFETQLEENRRRQGKGLHEQTKVFEANQKVKIASAREKTLLRELEVNVKTWAQDKAQYEVQLAEYRARVQILEEELTTYRNKIVTHRQQSRITDREAIESSHSRTARIDDNPNPISQPPTRASQDIRNRLQPQSRAEEERRRQLMSVSRQLSSRNSLSIAHPQSVFGDSIEPRLSF